MAPQLNIFSAIAILGVLQGIFLAFVVLTQKRKRRLPNVFLSILILSITLTVVHGILFITRYYYLVPEFLGVINPLPFLFGCSLYFHVKAFSRKDFRFNKSDIFHFLPFVLHLLYMINFYTKSLEYKLQVVAGFYSNEIPEDWAYISVLQFITTIVYSILSLKLLKTYKQNIKNEYSSIEKINLNWMRNLIVSMFIMVGLAIALRISGYHTILPAIYSVYIATIVYLFGYLFLRQPEIYIDYLENPSSQQNVKYEKSGLSQSRLESLKEKLINLMEKEKLFTDNELSAKNLAEKLSISQHNLSQLINEHFNQTFFDFVNHYRVEEAKKLLTSPEGQNFTVIAIGFDVGFNSKSTFNAVFKRFTQKTPSQYRLTSKVA